MRNKAYDRRLAGKAGDGASLGEVSEDINKIVSDMDALTNLVTDFAETTLLVNEEFLAAEGMEQAVKDIQTEMADRKKTMHEEADQILAGTSALKDGALNLVRCARGHSHDQRNYSAKLKNAFADTTELGDTLRFHL